MLDHNILRRGYRIMEYAQRKLPDIDHCKGLEPGLQTTLCYSYEMTKIHAVGSFESLAQDWIEGQPKCCSSCIYLSAYEITGRCEESIELLTK